MIDFDRPRWPPLQLGQIPAPSAFVTRVRADQRSLPADIVGDTDRTSERSLDEKSAAVTMSGRHLRTRPTLGYSLRFRGSFLVACRVRMGAIPSGRRCRCNLLPNAGPRKRGSEARNPTRRCGPTRWCSLGGNWRSAANPGREACRTCAGKPRQGSIGTGTVVDGLRRRQGIQPPASVATMRPRFDEPAGLTSVATERAPIAVKIATAGRASTK